MSAPLRDPMFWFASALHCVLALCGKWVFDVHIDAHPVYNNWDSAWQVLPVHLLEHQLFESVLSLHSQPPVFNLLCGWFVKTFHEHHMDAFQHFNIFLSALMCGMCWTLLSGLLGRGPLVKIVVLLLCLHPSLQLYSAFPTYDVLTAFLCLLVLWCLACFRQTNEHVWLIIFISSLNVLVLTRSAFHLLLVIAALALVWLLISRNRKLMITCFLLCMPAVAWYTKNWVQYGFFGASSWFGMNFFRAASTYYEVFPDHSLQEMAHRGVIDPLVVEFPKFTLPHRYRVQGYDKVSNLPALVQDDFHNVNFVDISKRYGNNALSLISAHPVGYIRGVLLGYSRFWIPSFEFPDVQWNRKGVAPLIAIHSLIQGVGLDFLHLGPYRLTSVLMLLYPLALLCFIIRCLAMRRFLTAQKWSLRFSLHEIKSQIFENLVLVWSAFFTLYSCLVFTLFEYGENQRFKFSIELMVLVFVVVMFVHVARSLFRSSKA